MNLPIVTVAPFIPVYNSFPKKPPSFVPKPLKNVPTDFQVLGSTIFLPIHLTPSQSLGPNHFKPSQASLAIPLKALNANLPNAPITGHKPSLPNRLAKVKPAIADRIGCFLIKFNKPSQPFIPLKSSTTPSHQFLISSAHFPRVFWKSLPNKLFGSIPLSNIVLNVSGLSVVECNSSIDNVQAPRFFFICSVCQADLSNKSTPNHFFVNTLAIAANFNNIFATHSKNGATTVTKLYLITSNVFFQARLSNLFIQSFQALLNIFNGLINVAICE